MQVRGEDQVLAVGSPTGFASASRTFRAGEWQVAAGELARSSAFGGDHKALSVSGFEISTAVEAVNEVVVDFRRIGPFRAFWRFGQRCDLQRIGGNEG